MRSSFITSSDSYLAFGNNKEGQLGEGNASKFLDTPTLFKVNGDIITLASGFKHTMVLLK